jgi:hypothetical protein
MKAKYLIIMANGRLFLSNKMLDRQQAGVFTVFKTVRLEDMRVIKAGQSEMEGIPVWDEYIKIFPVK